MSTEPQPTRESYTGWVIGVGVLLLLAAAVPIGLKLYGPREMVMDLQGDPGGQIVWRFQSGFTTQTGVTNLPAKLVFHARSAEFIVRRMNYTGPLLIYIVEAGDSRGGASSDGGTGGFRFQLGWNRGNMSEMP